MWSLGTCTCSALWHLAATCVQRREDRLNVQDFNSDVPGETAELWVGTPYAAWIASWLSRMLDTARQKPCPGPGG